MRVEEGGPKRTIPSPDAALGEKRVVSASGSSSYGSGSSAYSVVQSSPLQRQKGVASTLNVQANGHDSRDVGLHGPKHRFGPPMLAHTPPLQSTSVVHGLQIPGAHNSSRLASVAEPPQQDAQLTEKDFVKPLELALQGKAKAGEAASELAGVLAGFVEGPIAGVVAKRVAELAIRLVTTDPNTPALQAAMRKWDEERAKERVRLQAEQWFLGVMKRALREEASGASSGDAEALEGLQRAATRLEYLQEQVSNRLERVLDGEGRIELVQEQHTNQLDRVLEREERIEDGLGEVRGGVEQVLEMDEAEAVARAEVLGTKVR